MASGTLEIVDTYTTILCCKCGITFAVTSGFEQHLRDTKTGFYCPNGHSLVFGGKTRAQKQAERADEAEVAAERLRQQLRRREDDLQAERRHHSATKGQLTKTRRRAAHGVCPCCTRSFANVERHMASQHPEYVETAKA